jgi:hypothetical protein
MLIADAVGWERLDWALLCVRFVSLSQHGQGPRLVGAVDALATEVVYSDSNHDPQQVLADLPADDAVLVESVSRDQANKISEKFLAVVTAWYAWLPRP